MPDGDDVHDRLPVVDCVDDPIIAHTYPPEVLFPLDLPTTFRPRLRLQSHDLGQHPAACSSFSAEREKLIWSLRIELAVAAQALHYGLQRRARLVLTGVGDDPVIEVLPEFAMLSEIDHHGCLLACLIDDVLNTLHEHLLYQSMRRERAMHTLPHHLHPPVCRQP
jgi:hypothetical protein